MANAIPTVEKEGKVKGFTEKLDYSMVRFEKKRQPNSESSD
jgi:hypothetical protein